MKKFLYILSVLAVITLFNSCTKEGIFTCEELEDPFAQENFDDDSETRGTITGPDGGGIVDPDGDDDDIDEDDIVDPDGDDDDSDEDDDEALDDREGDADED